MILKDMDVDAAMTVHIESDVNLDDLVSLQLTDLLRVPSMHYLSRPFTVLSLSFTYFPVLAAVDYRRLVSSLPI